MGLWQTIQTWFSAKPATPSALDIMGELKSERTDVEWIRLTNRLASLVLGEADQQRIWKRAHRGADESARLLSGIRQPTAGERRRLTDLIEELERGR